MKKFTIGLVLGFLLASSVMAFASGQAIKLIVNGSEVFSDVSPQNINGRVMTPARPLAEALGANVEWDSANNTVVVTSSPINGIIKENGEGESVMDNAVQNLKLNEPYVTDDFSLSIGKLEYYSKAPLWTDLDVSELPQTHKIKDIKVTVLIDTHLDLSDIYLDIYGYKMLLHGEMGVLPETEKRIQKATVEKCTRVIDFNDSSFSFNQEYTGFIQSILNNNYLLFEKIALYDQKDNLVAIWSI